MKNKNIKEPKNICVYCEPHKYISQDEVHFSCEACVNCMCDNCYNNDTEHDKHYNRPLDNIENEEGRKLIINACNGSEPEYLCEDCLDNILKKEES